MTEIEIIDNDNNVYGYISSVDDESGFVYFGAFFTEEQVENLKKWLKEKNIMEFSVLRNIYIDEDSRGQGFGKKLVTQFIQKSKNIAIILLASPDEEDFNLVDWYQSMGFEITPFLSEDGPLLIKY